MTPVSQAAFSSELVLFSLFALQGLWALFLIVLTWSMRRVLTDIKENTKATNSVAESVNGINVLLAGNFVRIPEMTRMDERLRKIQADVIALQTRDDLYRDLVRGERRKGT